MATKEIDILFNTKSNEAGADKTTDALKRMEAQAARTRQTLQKIGQVGTQLGVAGAAILAPFALAMNSYVSAAQKAEDARVSSAKEAVAKMESLEEDRVNAVDAAAVAINGIDEEIAANRISLAESAANAEAASLQVVLNLKQTIADIDRSAADRKIAYDRRVFDMTHTNLTEQQKAQIELNRLTEDFNRANLDDERKKAEARKKAADEQKKIKDEQNKAALEAQKTEDELEAKKAAERKKEAAALLVIKKEEEKIRFEQEQAAASQTDSQKRIIQLQDDWNASMQQLGKIVTVEVLPYLEQGMGYISAAIDWLEKNPEAVTALLGAGATLLTAAAVLQTISQVGLFLSGISSIAGTLGLGGAAAGGGALAGLGASIAAAISAAAPFVAIAAAVTIAAEGTRQLMNWALGTSQTWSDIWTTVTQIAMLAGMGFEMIFKSIGDGVKAVGDWLYNLPGKIGEFIYNGVNYIVDGVTGIITWLGDYLWSVLDSLGTTIVSGLANILGIPGFADGGMIGSESVIRAGEGNRREFMLSNPTVRAAERIIGGTLTQERLLSALSSNKQLTYNDSRRFDSRVSASERRMIANETLSLLSGAL